jgi:hypothetical protein
VQRQLISITVRGGANIAGRRVAAAVVAVTVVTAAVVAVAAAAVVAARITVSLSLLTFSCMKALFRVQCCGSRFTGSGPLLVIKGSKKFYKFNILEYLMV